MAPSPLDARARRRIIAKGRTTVSDRPDSKSEARVWVVEPGQSRPRTDQVATEEPLEIRLRAAGIAADAGPLAVFRRRSQGAGQRTVAITMRTPGADVELAAGFLYGGVRSRGTPARGPGRRRAPQRARQGRGLGAARRPPAAQPTHRDGQRPEQLRDPPEVPDGGSADRVRGLGSQQPGRIARARV